MSVVELNAGNWVAEVEGSKQPVVVDFWHAQCIWCKRLEPVYSELSSKYGGRLKFAKLDIFASSGNTAVAEKYGVSGTPTLILFCKGRAAGSLVGYRPKDQLDKELEHLLSHAHECVNQSTQKSK